MTKILVVVDYQNDFVTGSLGFEKAVKLKQGIVDKIHEYGKEGAYIICTLDTHDKNYLNTQEGKNLPIEHCIAGTPGWRVVAEVEEAANYFNTKYIQKNTFPSAGLLEELRRIYALEKRVGGKTDTIIEFCGVVTDICVISNVVIAKAALPEAKIIVNSNLCASNNDEMHQKALDVMRSIQVEVV